MITDQSQINFFKKIAQIQFSTILLSDYSDDYLVFFTDSITNIYKYLDYVSFNKVTIYLPLTKNLSLSNLGANPLTIYSLENLTPLNGEEITLELILTGEINAAIGYSPDVESIRVNSLVYTFEKHLAEECIYGKNDKSKLIPIPGADSYFAVQTFRELNSALDYYKSKVARHSDCEILRRVWFDEKRIFLKASPEHRLRDSLTQYLKISLRNTEVRPEQVVDRSHPVDIKVTWALANRLALIEIKWLGKSLASRKKQFTKQFFESRALDGASQLASYLDGNIQQAPTYTTQGYLVIFDARRKGCTTATESINKSQVLDYDRQEIQYNPQYENIRRDFAKPLRFFMEPLYG
ncbi:hypothetical protein GCM10023091_16390 [Ravibacter arvi]|uniref:PD-(D/E)XK nuclease superfamily protein n=1 Tax=Ravibacter arvi TaxID=2051041 RepID=A0ABP8LW63_9BACT